jgi:hypothetical protein
MHGLPSQTIFQVSWMLFEQGTQLTSLKRPCHLVSSQVWQQMVLLSRKDRNYKFLYIRKALNPSNLPGTGNEPVSKQIVSRVLSDVSPIVSAALLSVSQLKAKRAASK